MSDEPIAYVDFADGVSRPVFEQVNGRQYVLDDEGERAYGVWLIPAEEADTPLIVNAVITDPPRMR
jgi:hypothetical protein